MKVILKIIQSQLSSFVESVTQKWKRLKGRVLYAQDAQKEGIILLFDALYVAKKSYLSIKISLTRLYVIAVVDSDCHFAIDNIL